jgi:hypothetical protein
MSREHMFRRRVGVGQWLAGLLGLAVVSLVALAGPASSKEPLYRSDGLAVSGYDVVAYFNDGRPVEGRPEYATEWSGARWRFATAANRDAFVAGPTRYAPQYGGYCAYAVSKGYTASADPIVWRIVDGRLYLNYSKSVQRLWEQDIPGHIANANGNWPAVLAK